MQFQVNDMTCGGCAKSVAKAITNLDQNAKVDADPPTRTVKVETSASQSEVMRVLADAGFPAVPK